MSNESIRLKVEIREIHEIQLSEVTNYRNPTPATKSTATLPKANYRNPPALDSVFKNGFTTLSCPVVHTPQWTPAYFKVYALGVNYRILGLSVASAINPTGTVI